MSCAPKVFRCGVVHWMSSSLKPRSRSRSTSATSATFEASVAVWNMLSPKNTPRSATPYNPPTSSPNIQHSTLCA